MIVYAKDISPRLRYAVSRVEEMLHCGECMLTNEEAELKRYSGARIWYSPDPAPDDAYHIVPSGLLSETGWRSTDPGFSVFRGLPSLFPTAGDHGFDLFSAAFFLISRYEEYGSPSRDSYGRYDFRASTAWRHQFLHRPLVNEWALGLRKLLQSAFSMESWKPLPRMEIIPTYDIDEAWSFRHKSRMVTMGGILKDIARFKWYRIHERRAVRGQRLTDPFDSFQWMDELNERFGLQPRYFFLVAGKRARYDRNIHPSVPEFRNLVRRHAQKYLTGLHPSWQSVAPGVLESEIAVLTKITGLPVTRSRQHYIRFTIPQTYRRLQEAGISEDYSMGYGSVNGFRASVCTPFPWYDIERDEQTQLMIFPFCFMDANSFFEQGQDAGAALEEMKAYAERVREVHGTFISIWHNTFLGTDKLFQGWRNVYQEFWKTFSL